MNKRCFKKVRLLLCVILCFAIVLLFVGCKKDDISQNEIKLTGDDVYDISETDYETYVEYDDMFLTVEMEYLNDEGYVETNDVPALLDEVERLIIQGIEDESIAYYHKEDDNIFIKFSTGIPYLFVPYQQDVLSTGTGGKIITVEPNENDYSVNQSRILAMIDAWANDIPYEDSLRPTSNAKSIVNALPNLYSYDKVPLDLFKPVVGVEGSLRNENVTVERMKALADYKIIIWEGHGAYNEKIHSALVTGESFVGWKEFSKYKDDLANDILVLTSFPTIGDTDIAFSPIRYYCITSKFVEKYIGEMDESLIYLGACDSLKDEVLANAFIKKGASVVLGYTEVTSMPYEMLSRALFFYNLVQNDGSGLQTVADAYQNTISIVGSDFYSSNGSILSYYSQDGIDDRYTLNGILDEQLWVEIPTGKRLSQINGFDEAGNLETEQHIHYNENGQITNIDYVSHGEYASESKTVLTYDDEGRLVSRLSGDFSGAEYTYNSIGQITRIVSWEGGGGEELYEYDAEGKITKITENYDIGTYVTEYTYDTNGILIGAVKVCTEYGMDPWTETITYTYDSKNRLTQEACEGEYSNTSYRYDYTFANLVLNEYFINGERSQVSAHYYDASGSDACGLALRNPQFYADEDGYLAKIVDTFTSFGKVETKIYEFYYDGVLSSPLDVSTDTSISQEQVVTHTYDEAESLLYEYLGEIYGFDGLEVRQVTSAAFAGTRLEMTISGEGGAPIYIIEFYTVNLDTGEVRNVDTYKVICDLW